MANQTSQFPLPYDETAQGFDEMVNDKASRFGADAAGWKVAVMKLLKRGWYNSNYQKVSSTRRSERIEQAFDALKRLNEIEQNPEVKRLLEKAAKKSA